MARKAPSKTSSLPAPIGGWNARDAYADMAETDAIQLTNWFPTPSQVMLRQGFTNWSTGLPGQVNAVMAYNGGTTQKLFAASQSGIYDCTSGGAVGAAVVTGLSSDHVIHTNFATPGGNFLVTCNGTDSVRNFDGTSWTVPAITGVTSANLNFVYAAKQRLWFVEKNSLRVWYLPTQSIAGAALSLDFSSLCRNGGYLVSMASWTVSGGFGQQDYTVFVTSEGEVLIYAGYDPSSGNVWELQGIWKMGSPMGNKCFMKYGADLLYISKDGLTPMSQGRFFADVSHQQELTDKIQWAISQATTLYASNYGWCIQPYPLNNMLILNIPKGAGLQEQYVMNSVTDAWCNFTGWNANCWELYQDNIYFGGNGVVSLAWNGYADNGSQVLGDAIQAPNYFGSRGLLKRWTMMRPILSSSGVPAIYANINVDFDTTPPSNLLSYSGATASLWDSGKWDSAIWGSDVSIYKTWQGVNGIGYSASPRFISAGNGIQVNWISTDFVYEPGAIL
jgi:hypothetical protein